MSGFGPIEGKTITGCRPMTIDELVEEGWEADDFCMVIELNDGTRIYPSRDMEGNGPGVFFGTTTEGDQFGIC